MVRELAVEPDDRIERGVSARLAAEPRTGVAPQPLGGRAKLERDDRQFQAHELLDDIRERLGADRREECHVDVVRFDELDEIVALVASGHLESLRVEPKIERSDDDLLERQLLPVDAPNKIAHDLRTLL